LVTYDLELGNIPHGDIDLSSEVLKFGGCCRVIIKFTCKEQICAKELKNSIIRYSPKERVELIDMFFIVTGVIILLFSDRVGKVLVTSFDSNNIRVIPCSISIDIFLLLKLLSCLKQFR
jgi:hypothetical protein